MSGEVTPPVDAPTLHAVLAWLRDRGVFIALPMHVGSFGNVEMVNGGSPSDVLAFARDPIAFEAAYFRMSVPEFMGWLEGGEHPGVLFCAGRTRRGRRCRQMLAQGLSPQAWATAEREGRYCSWHGEPPEEDD